MLFYLFNLYDGPSSTIVAYLNLFWGQMPIFSCLTPTFFSLDQFFIGFPISLIKSMNVVCEKNLFFGVNCTFLHDLHQSYSIWTSLHKSQPFWNCFLPIRDIFWRDFKPLWSVFNQFTTYLWLTMVVIYHSRWYEGPSSTILAFLNLFLRVNFDHFGVFLMSHFVPFLWINMKSS